VGAEAARVTIVSVLRLPVLPEARETFARTFRELGVFERSRESGGFRGGRLLAPLGGDGPFLVVAEWDDAASYQAWLDNPVRAEVGEHLQPLIAEEVLGGELYEEAE
jgi:heme-degrading monooxygenase HmoA